MANDIANEIVNRAIDMCTNCCLSVNIRLCLESGNMLEGNQELDKTKTYTYFRKVPFEVDPNIGSFVFSITTDKKIIYENFTFIDFEESLKMLLYQYILHASYIQDITTYDIVLIDINDINNKKNISFCFPITLSEIPLSELHTITAEVIEKILEPITIVYGGWRQVREKL
jgi:hypothetical protein